MPPTRQSATSALFQRVVQAGAERGKCGSQSAEQSGTTANSRANPITIQFRPISPIRGKLSGSMLFPTRRATAASRIPSKPPLTLRMRLSRNAVRKSADDRRAQGLTNGSFALAANGAHQQQPGQVGAGDQQHNGHRQKQCPHQRARLLYRFLLERTNHWADAQTRHERRIAAHYFLCDTLRVGPAPAPRFTPAFRRPTIWKFQEAAPCVSSC